MQSLIPIRIVALALLLACGTLAGCATSDTCTPGAACTGDARMSEDVRAALALHPALAAPNVVHVQTRNGTVYLTGQVATSLQRDEAEAAARTAPGVKHIVNNIALGYHGR
ncbi:MAG TPA: BON domain-containing protein [Steroidobacteraceae bacterium]|nr:BON domain-containing protein [Steroidobacteraceae bacterium]